MTEKITAVTRKIAEFIVKTDPSSISDDIYEHAKVAFMDWIAVTLGGKTDSLVKKLIILSGKFKLCICVKLDNSPYT